MRIIITGTPGTGKSTVADILGKTLKLGVVHVSQFAKKEKLITGKRNGSYIVDLKKLRKKLLKKKGIIESHLLCEFPLPRSIVFVLRCNPRVLVKRLKKRRYSKRKTRENLECEALDYCTINAETHYNRVYDVDTTKLTAEKTAKKIIAIMQKKKKGDKVDFSNYFL